MTESTPKSSSSQLGPILDLFSSAGYGGANRDGLSDLDKLVGGFAWCISSANSEHHSFKIDTVEDIEAALRLVGCPYAIQATQIKNMDCIGIYPAVQWLVSLAKTQQRDSGHENEKKAALLTELQLLKERIDDAGIDSTVQRLVPLLKMSKALERQGSEFESECDRERIRSLSEITSMEEEFLNDNGNKDAYDYLDKSLRDSSENLKMAQKERTSTLREYISLKRQLDEVPIEAELVQYERRFSELNNHMQDRLCRTRKFYDTYNALLEIKDLMLKETSLLNSIDLQFREAIGNPAGRMKLIDSMETIFKGTRQKLEKVQLGLQVEQNALDTLREKFRTAVMNQHHCAKLSKAFKEECRRNELLKEELSKAEKIKGQTSF